MPVALTVSTNIQNFYYWALAVACIFLGRAMLCTALAMHMYGPFLKWILRSSRLEAALMGLAKARGDVDVTSVLQARLQPWSIETFFFAPSPLFEAPDTVSSLQNVPAASSTRKLSLEMLAKSVTRAVFGHRERMSQVELEAEFRRATNVGVSQNIFYKFIDRDQDGVARPADLEELYCAFFADRKDLYNKLNTRSTIVNVTTMLFNLLACVLSAICIFWIFGIDSKVSPSSSFCAIDSTKYAMFFSLCQGSLIFWGRFTHLAK